VWSERSEDPLARLYEVEARSNPAPVIVELGGASGAPPRPPSLRASESRSARGGGCLSFG